MENLLLDISPKKYFNFQIKIFAILLICNFLFAPFFLNNNLDPFNLHKLFIFELERNLPTLFATFNFFSSSIILYYIYLSPILSKKYKLNWFFLSILFSFFGIDEFAGIHEKLGSVFVQFAVRYNFFDFLHNWMSLYIFIIIFILIFNLKFLKNMEENLFRDITFAFILYVSGAILMEGDTPNDVTNFDKFVLWTIEESFELLGLIFFNFALLKYFCKNSKSIKVKIN